MGEFLSVKTNGKWTESSHKEKSRFIEEKGEGIFFETFSLIFTIFGYLYFLSKFALLRIIQSIPLLSYQEKREATEEIESRVIWAERRNAAEEFKGGKVSSRNCPNERTRSICVEVQ